MATSTTTFLQLIQAALLNIGERPIVSYSAMTDTDPRKFASRKALSGIQDALLNIQTASDWDFVKEFAVFDAADWTNDLLTITDTDFNRVLGVTFRQGTGLGYELEYVTRSVYDTMRITQGFPRYYCPLDVEDGTILINPYPGTDELKTSFKVQVSANLNTITGTDDAQVFPVPERFIPYIRLYTEAFLLENHLGDSNMSQLKYRTAAEKLRMLSVRYQNVASGHRTMYRGRRKYNNG